MGRLFIPFDAVKLTGWEEFLGEWFFYFSIAFLGFELVRYLLIRRFRPAMAGDVLANFGTLILFYGLTYFLLAGLYLSVYAWTAQFALFDIPVNAASLIACILLADLAYYWEHRFMHRVGVAWATHSTHHSSPFFNISVAYRFGPMDGVWPIFFHLPLVLMGFNPFLVFFAELMVQLYQSALHTEAVKKLPRPIEAVFNTPSHHRVHHGSNLQYLDKNYGGILILWDRLFGTFAKEEEKVVYGLVEPIPEIKGPFSLLAAPFTAFFHGFTRLAGKIGQAQSAGEVWMRLFGPPDWRPRRER
jgi:sterol desaturase/sphingolipid hydroxylase (fatty acid hydroxylase superfamily)